jgi:hypothetical protein
MNKENQNPVYLIRLYEWSKNAADYLRENVENPFEAIRYCYINYLLELNSEIKKVNKRWDNYCEYTYYSDLNIDNLYTIGQICDLLAKNKINIFLRKRELCEGRGRK